LYKKNTPHWYDTSMAPDMSQSTFAEEEMDCGCQEDRVVTQPGQRKLLAHSYVLWQTYTEAFSPKEALMHGTLFPELFGVYPIPE